MSWVPVVKSTEASVPPTPSTTHLPFLDSDTVDDSNNYINNYNMDNNIYNINSNIHNLENITQDQQEPAEVIVARVLYALLISISLVVNLLLVIAVLRCRGKVLVIYLLTSAMVFPDIIFYTKLIVELTDWGVAVPAWAVRDQSCGIWQFGSHIYPILYSTLLTAIVYHAFITLFLDHSGKYEKRCRRLLPLVLLAILVFLVVITSPSGFYARAKAEYNSTAISSPTHTRSDGGSRQYCDLFVPSITGSEGSDVQEQANVTYRLVYELVLPYLLPLSLLAFPYVCLLVGLMRSLSATDHSEHSTKMTVVVTLWLVTSYLMMHVATVLRNVFSIFSVWHKLTALLDAVNDPRVPQFQTYIHITAYALTILWAIARPALVFKYCPRLRKALGP